MNTNEREFSPQESLQLIRSMIESTKTSIGDNSAFFLLWGYATLFGCITQYYLLAIAHYARHYYAWLITPVALLLHIIFLYKYKRRQKVRTFIDDANKYVWVAIGFAFLVLFLIFAAIGWQYSFPFYIMLYGIGTYVSGSLLSFRAMKFGGLTCLALAAVTPYLPYASQILLSGFAILISYIIPGHLLRNQYRKTKSLTP